MITVKYVLEPVGVRNRIALPGSIMRGGDRSRISGKNGHRLGFGLPCNHEVKRADHAGAAEVVLMSPSPPVADLFGS
jgi:hypothetical protein